MNSCIELPVCSLSLEGLISFKAKAQPLVFSASISHSGSEGLKILERGNKGL